VRLEKHNSLLERFQERAELWEINDVVVVDIVGEEQDLDLGRGQGDAEGLADLGELLGVDNAVLVDVKHVKDCPPLGLLVLPELADGQDEFVEIDDAVLVEIHRPEYFLNLRLCWLLRQPGNENLPDFFNVERPIVVFVKVVEDRTKISGVRKKTNASSAGLSHRRIIEVHTCRQKAEDFLIVDRVTTRSGFQIAQADQPPLNRSEPFEN
jgi:hypothetical protein